MRETSSELLAFSDANATWTSDALRKLVRPFADPSVAYVCGRAAARASRRLEQGGRLLALRDGAPRRRVEARLGHRRERLDLRGATGRLRRGHPRFGHDLLAPVSDGSARTASGVRARRGRLREADPDERKRVPAQGADVRALLADRLARRDDAAPRAAVRAADRLASPASLRSGCSISSARSSLALAGEGGSTSPCSRRSWTLLRRPRPRRRFTTSSSSWQPRVALELRRHGTRRREGRRSHAARDRSAGDSGQRLSSADSVSSSPISGSSESRKPRAEISTNPPSSSSLPSDSAS